jgi:two-component system chemotaxis response regulator CheY
MHSPANVIKLASVLDLAAADGLLDTLRGKLEAGQALCLDASGVETLTLPCVQVVLAALRSHEDIAIVNPSAEFLAAFADLGLDCSDRCRTVEIANAESDPELPAIEAAAAGADLDPSPVAEPEVAGAAPPIAASCEAGAAEEVDSVQMPISEGAMKKRILTIDDSKTMRDMLMVTLADAGFDVIQGVDGQDGIQTLGDKRVDVVITDINMPKMDGYEVIRQLRRNPVHKTTPILVLTTESDAEKRSLARAAGATGWMVKPFDPDQLVATIRKVSP